MGLFSKKAGGSWFGNLTRNLGINPTPVPRQDGPPIESAKKRALNAAQQGYKPKHDAVTTAGVGVNRNKDGSASVASGSASPLLANPIVLVILALLIMGRR